MYIGKIQEEERKEFHLLYATIIVKQEQLLLYSSALVVEH